jgi:hypothetical protein
MFKKFFGQDKSEAPVRSLDNPRKLKQGDFIRIGFDKHQEISNADFIVQKVTGLDLSARSGYERSVIHLGQTDDNRPLLMWVDDDGNAERLAFAYGADQPHVETMINVEQFSDLFNPDRDYLVEVDSHPSSLKSNTWLSSKYIQDQACEVYWLDRDPVDVGTTEAVSTDERTCDYFRLISKDQEAAIEVFVFDGGKTDVYFIVYLPLFKIEEMMPPA